MLRNNFLRFLVRILFFWVAEGTANELLLCHILKLLSFGRVTLNWSTTFVKPLVKCGSLFCVNKLLLYHLRTMSFNWQKSPVADCKNQFCGKIHRRSPKTLYFILANRGFNFSGLSWTFKLPTSVHVPFIVVWIVLKGPPIVIITVEVMMINMINRETFDKLYLSGHIIQTFYN